MSYVITWTRDASGTREIRLDSNSLVGAAQASMVAAEVASSISCTFPDVAVHVTGPSGDRYEYRDGRMLVEPTS